MRPTKGTTLFLAVAVAMVISGALFAREQNADPTSFAALTAEVRLLRLAVEKSTQTQAQIQAMAVYLSAQQSRLLQVSARADAVRKDLETAVRERSQLADMVSEAERALAGPPPTAPNGKPIPDMRQAELADMKRGLARVAAVEAEMRGRESEAAAAVQSELNRWSEMIARLEAAARQ